MSIQFSGLASGFPTDSIIQQLLAIESRPIDLLTQRKQTISTEQAQYKAVSTRISSLGTSLLKLTDAKLGSAFDLFQAKTATSSTTTTATATVTNDATAGSFTLDVLNLATATRAASLTPVGNYTTGASAVNTVAEGVISSGNFTVFVNNQARTITVDKDVDTVQDVIDRIATEISTVTGGAASATVDAQGKVALSYNPGTTVQFGATGDTSNFGKVTHLTTGSDNAPASDTFTAKYGTSTIDKEGTLIGNAVGLQNNTIVAGTFTIGGATFDIDASTTMAGLISQINNSSKAGAMISYNQTSNKYEIVSKNAGEQAITFNDNGTGFLESLGVVSGADTLSSQTLGLNAQFQINGGDILESASNSVDASVTGLTGVTLNLAAAGTTSIDVKQDTEPLKAAINDFITKFNAAVSFIDEQTKKDAVLNGESGLTRLRNNLRTTIFDSVSGLTEFSTLSQVGISTGAVNTSPGQGAPSSTVSLNESKLLEALAKNPDEVKKLFIGDGAAITGVIGKLDTLVKNAMDVEFGIFTTRDKSANDQIKSINDAIKRKKDQLEVRERQLRQQFGAMEKLIGQLQQQSSAIAGLGGLF